VRCDFPVKLHRPSAVERVMVIEAGGARARTMRRVAASFQTPLRESGGPPRISSVAFNGTATRRMTRACAPPAFTTITRSTALGRWSFIGKSRRTHTMASNSKKRNDD